MLRMATALWCYTGNPIIIKMCTWFWAYLEMIVVLETSNARPQRIAVFLYGHGSASTISQRTYFCHVPGHIYLLSLPPEECLPVGECLFVILRTMPLSCLHILGADFPSLVNYVLAQKRLRCGVINRESCFLRTSGPPTDCQVSRSDMHFLDFIHSLWKVQNERWT